MGSERVQRILFNRFCPPVRQVLQLARGGWCEPSAPEPIEPKEPTEPIEQDLLNPMNLLNPVRGDKRDRSLFVEGLREEIGAREAVHVARDGQAKEIEKQSGKRGVAQHPEEAHR
jgi:hypothetical protein